MKMWNYDAHEFVQKYKKKLNITRIVDEFCICCLLYLPLKSNITSGRSKRSEKNFRTWGTRLFTCWISTVRDLFTRPLTEISLIITFSRHFPSHLTMRNLLSQLQWTGSSSQLLLYVILYFFYYKMS
jgi:hypothetical protein